MFSVTKKFSSICKDIADAIRSKLEIDTKIKLKDFPDYIEVIEQDDIEVVLQSFPNMRILKTFSSLPLTGFRGLYSLQAIIAPFCTSIDSNAFANANLLEKIELPECLTIKYGAFYGCDSLSNVALPKCATITGNQYYPGAFEKCYRLTALYLPGSSLCVLSNIRTFSSTPLYNYSASAKKYGSIFVPASLLATYKSATNWALLSSRLTKIE